MYIFEQIHFFLHKLRLYQNSSDRKKIPCMMMNVCEYKFINLGKRDCLCSELFMLKRVPNNSIIHLLTWSVSSNRQHNKTDYFVQGFCVFARAKRMNTERSAMSLVKLQRNHHHLFSHSTPLVC